MSARRGEAAYPHRVTLRNRPAHAATVEVYEAPKASPASDAVVDLRHGATIAAVILLSVRAA